MESKKVSSNKTNSNSSPQQLSPSNKAHSISVSAPGKIILHGEHSVVYGKLAIAASLGLRTKFTFQEMEPSEIASSTVNLNLTAINLSHCYELEELQTLLLDEHIPLTKGASSFSLEKPELINDEQLLQRVDNFIMKNCGSIPLSSIQKLALTSFFYLFTAIIGPLNVPLQPFTATVTTELTVSSGLGSSASFHVATAAALVSYGRLKAQKCKDSTKNGYKGGKLTEFSKKDLDLISRWAFCAEKIIHGTPSGLDNTICTYGSLVEFRKGSTPKPIELNHKVQVLLVNTKVPKDTKALVSKVAGLKQKYPKIIDLVLHTMDEVSNCALQNLLKLNSITTLDISLDEYQKGIAEIYNDIADLVNINQGLLNSLGVSHPSLDAICITLTKAGLCGKLTGAGGGGYAISVVPPGYNKTALQEVIKVLQHKGFETALTDLGGPGVTLH